jgi:hypothetical protein
MPVGVLPPKPPKKVRIGSFPGLNRNSVKLLSKQLNALKSMRVIAGLTIRG